MKQDISMDFLVSAMEKINCNTTLSLDCYEKTSVAIQHKSFIKRVKNGFVLSVILGLILFVGLPAGTVYACWNLQNRQRNIDADENGYVIDDRNDIVGAEEIEGIIHNYNSDNGSVLGETSRVETEAEEFSSWEEARKKIDFSPAIPQIVGMEGFSLKIAYQKEHKAQMVLAEYMFENARFRYHVTKYTTHWTAQYDYDNAFNIRSYENAYGYRIDMLDYISPVNEKVGTYAVIAFEKYNVHMEFWGLSDEKIERILDGLDFAVYEEEVN